MSYQVGRTRVLCAGIFIAAASMALATDNASASLLIQGDMANSTEGLANFAGSIDYLHIAGNQGMLTITLTNTTDPLVGGYITGFAFNIDSTDPAAMATLIAESHPFIGMANVNGSPYGDFDAGAALGGNFQGAGAANTGIGVGDTGVFVFNILANDAATLSEMSFIATPGVNFLVRMRALNDGGSDKVPGTSVPAPAAASLLVMAGLVGTRRRRAAA